MNYDIVFYHDPCSDGLAALWATFIPMYQKPHPEPMTDLVGLTPGNKLPIKCYDGKAVLFLDIAPHIDEVLSGVLMNAKQVTVLDHHESNLDIWSKSDLIRTTSTFVTTFQNEYIHAEFHKNKAGCQIAWDYFHPGESRPWFIDYIGDSDLYKWELPDSEAINAALHSLDYINIPKLNWLHVHPCHKQEILKEGQTILRANDIQIERAYNDATPAILVNDIHQTQYNIWIGSDINPELKSKLGNKLCHKLMPNGQKPDFATVLTHYIDTDLSGFSMRSLETFSVKDVATQFNGGGHKCASKTNLYIEYDYYKSTELKKLCYNLYDKQEKYVGKLII